jgi:hypothetical protein
MTETRPELRRFCRDRQVERVEVDLRWGIALEQSTRKERQRSTSRSWRSASARLSAANRPASSPTSSCYSGSFTAGIGHRCAEIGVALKKARYSGQAVVMHPARCHAKTVPGTELDGKSGQCGQDGRRIKRLLSMICQWNQGCTVVYGGESGIRTGGSASH